MENLNPKDEEYNELTFKLENHQSHPKISAPLSN